MRVVPGGCHKAASTLLPTCRQPALGCCVLTRESKALVHDIDVLTEDENEVLMAPAALFYGTQEVLSSEGFEHGSDTSASEGGLFSGEIGRASDLEGELDDSSTVVLR